MNNKFKYIRRENIFAWESDNIKVEYSDPWLDYSTGTYEKRFNLKTLFTYRYTLTVWEKNSSADKKWNQLFQVRTGVEFEEAILHLWESLLFFMKNPKPDSLWEKHQVDKVWEYQLQEKIWVYSDKYIITKKVREEKETYDVYVGREFEDRDFDEAHSLGIWLPDLSIHDLKEWKRCIEAFMEYSLDKHNRDLQEDINVGCASYKYVNGKIYEYSISWEEKIVDYNVIKGIFTVGDRIGSGEFMHFGENNFYSESFGGQTITEITPEEMIMDSGDRIPLGKIVHMYRNPTEEMLSYDKSQITEEFMGILNEAELADFATLSEDDLFTKYGQAIIGRTRMFREEHGFVTSTEENWRERIQEIVREIIHEIKYRV